MLSLPSTKTPHMFRIGNLMSERMMLIRVGTPQQHYLKSCSSCVYLFFSLCLSLYILLMLCCSTSWDYSIQATCQVSPHLLRKFLCSPLNPHYFLIAMFSGITRILNEPEQLLNLISNAYIYSPT